MKKFEPKADTILQGEAVSPGVAIGRVLLYSGMQLVVDKRAVPAEALSAEIAKFHSAIANTKLDVNRDRAVALEQIGEAAAQVFE
ncbi:hypothetical protein HUU05_21215, partial [candidate division KSB1 bacterium]|nr:hypothetical protein [candidate division KSB1 bacterium]